MVSPPARPQASHRQPVVQGEAFLCLALPPARAICTRRALVKTLARAGPPFLPPARPRVLAAAVSPACFFLLAMAFLGSGADDDGEGDRARHLAAALGVGDGPGPGPVARGPGHLP